MIVLRRLRPEDLPAVVEVLAHWNMAPVAPSTACPVVDWYVRQFGYRVAGTAPKKHPFSLVEVDRWTVLELEL